MTKQSFKPKKPIKAVLWDLDGTLLMTEERYLAAVKAGYHDFNIPVNDDDMDYIKGHIKEKAFEMIGSRYDLKAVDFDAFNHHVEQHYLQTPSKPDFGFKSVPQVLAMIAASPVKQAIVSNGVKYHVEKAAKSLGENLFVFYTGIEDVTEGKPAPTPYLMACKRLNLEPAECLVVEDSVTGVTAGLAANMNVVARPHTHDYYLKNKDVYDRADLLVDDFEKVDWAKILGL